MLPSDIDIQAVTRCIADLLLHAKIQRSENRIAVVANRVKRKTVMFRSLMRFLDSLKIPVIAVIPDSQNYIRAAASGVGLHEMKGARYRVDQSQWVSLVDWIEHGTLPLRDSPTAQAAPGAGATAKEFDAADVQLEGERGAEPNDATDSAPGTEAAAEPDSDAPLRLMGVSAFIKRNP